MASLGVVVGLRVRPVSQQSHGKDEMQQMWKKADLLKLSYKLCLEKIAII